MYLRTASLLLIIADLAISGCGGGVKYVSLVTVHESCERIEQAIEDQNPCSTDLETVQGELACTRRVCDRLSTELEHEDD